MKRSFLVLLALPAFIQPSPVHAETTYVDTTCYMVVEEGKSSDATRLFLQKMGIDSEAVSRVAPTRFTVGARDFLSRVGGRFSYEAEGPVFIERVGRVGLYSVALRYSVGPLPKALKTVTVDFTLAELAKAKSLVQPAAKAIQLAAAKAGMKTGLAWIIGMEVAGKGDFRATVGLAK